MAPISTPPPTPSPTTARTNFSEWDEPALAQLLHELRAEDALDGVGYDETDIDSLLADLAADGDDFGEVDDPGPEDPPEIPVSRPGDLWSGSSANIAYCAATRATPTTCSA